MQKQYFNCFIFLFLSLKDLTRINKPTLIKSEFMCFNKTWKLNVVVDF